MTEQLIQSKISKYLKSKNWVVVKLMAVSQPGYPDLLCYKDGRIIWIEVKTKIGRLSKIQKYRIEQMREQKLEVYVINDLKQIKEII